MLRAVIAMAIVSLLWVGCSTPGGDVVQTPSESSTPTGAVASASPEEKPVRLEKTIIKTKQGQRWELEADVVDWMDDNAQAKAQEVTWFLLDDEGARTVRVESLGADVDLNAELVVFTGEVVAQRLGSEESLVVAHLIYNGKERLFHGSDGVLWKRKGFELAGETLTANAELDKVQLKGRVKGKTEGGLIKTDELGEPSEQRNR